MEPLRIIFMGTPEFALPTLAALIYSPHEVCAVYTQPPRPAHRGKKETPSPVHRLALAHGIPVYTPVTLKHKETQREFAAHGADVAVVAAYGLLLPDPILTACRFGCINVHPSRLPRWRGAAPIQRTVMAGDRETSICIMQMDAGLDTGDILLEVNYPVPVEMTAGELHDMLAREAGAIVLETLHRLEAGSASPLKQPEEGVTYARKISKEEARIDWNRPARDLYNLIRGLSPSPGAFFEYQGERIKILGADIFDSDKRETCGVTLDERLTIQCADGAIRPTVIQRPGKKPMGTEEMLRGHPVPAGTWLG